MSLGKMPQLSVSTSQDLALQKQAFTVLFQDQPVKKCNKPEAKEKHQNKTNKH